MSIFFFRMRIAMVSFFGMLFLFFGVATSFAFLTKEQRENLNAPKEREIPVETLSVQLRDDKLPVNLAGSALRLPQTGESAGIFTREVSMQGERTDVSVLFSLGTKALDEEGKPFLGVLFPADKKAPSDLPEPQLENAILLALTEVSAEKSVFFDPAGTIRFILPEKQIGNTEATIYFFDSEKKEYILLETTLSPDGEGISAPFSRTGLYAFYDRKASPGKKEPVSNDESPLPQDPEKEPILQKPRKDLPLRFLDIQHHWARDFVATAVDRGLFSDKKPLFRPDEEATRAELVKMLVLQKFSEEEAQSCLTIFPSPFVPVFFPDVAQNQWYAPYICLAAREKMITGRSDGSFEPNTALSRAEALFLMVNASGMEESPEASPTITFADVPPNEWYSAAVRIAKNAGVVQGKETPQTPLVIHAEELSLGQISPEVETLQKILSILGFYQGPMHGEVDFLVKEAVFQFQKSQGILTDRSHPSAGVIGDRTLLALNALQLSSRPEGVFFLPTLPITRAELAKIAISLLPE